MNTKKPVSYEIATVASLTLQAIATRFATVASLTLQAGCEYSGYVWFHLVLIAS